METAHAEDIQYRHAYGRPVPSVPQHTSWKAAVWSQQLSRRILRDVHVFALAFAAATAIAAAVSDLAAIALYLLLLEWLDCWKAGHHPRRPDFSLDDTGLAEHQQRRLQRRPVVGRHW